MRAGYAGTARAFSACAMIRSAARPLLGLAMLAAAIAPAWASECPRVGLVEERLPCLSSAPVEADPPMVEKPFAEDFALRFEGPDIAVAAAEAFLDPSGPMKVVNAAWAGGVLALTVVEAMRADVAAAARGVELRPLVAPGARASVGIEVFGRF